MMSLGLISASLAMTDAEHASLGWIERSRQLDALAPEWYRPVRIILNTWMWGEFVVMMTNRKRRALHDFIAGTVVIVNESDQRLRRPSLPRLGAGEAEVGP